MVRICCPCSGETAEKRVVTVCDVSLGFSPNEALAPIELTGFRSTRSPFVRELHDNVELWVCEDRTSSALEGLKRVSAQARDTVLARGASKEPPSRCVRFQFISREAWMALNPENCEALRSILIGSHRNIFLHARGLALEPFFMRDLCEKLAVRWSTTQVLPWEYSSWPQISRTELLYDLWPA